jgi:hypothetical protein
MDTHTYLTDVSDAGTSNASIPPALPPGGKVVTASLASGSGTNSGLA